MKKIIQLTIFLFIIFSLNFGLAVLAQQPTSEPQTPSTPSAQTEKNQDIEKIRQAVKDKVKEKIDQIVNKSNQKTGWVGQITNIADNQISLTSLNQDARIVLIDQEDTSIINSKRQQIDSDQLKKDQIILAMGYTNTEGQLLAKRILITNKPLESLKNTIVLATVTDISQTTSTMTLVTNSRQVYQVKTNKNTKDVLKNQKIIAVLKQDGESTNNWQIIDFKIFSSQTTPTITPTSTPTTTESE